MRHLTLFLAALALAGCASDIQSADLFVLTRTGPHGTLTMLVSDGGTIRCDGGRARPLPDPLLLAARDVATSLDQDFQNGERFRPSPGSVYRYSFRMSDGTLSFPDRAASGHPDLAHAEQFVLQATQGPCAGVPGS